MRKKRIANEIAPQMISLVAGRMGLLLASSAPAPWSASWNASMTALRRIMTAPLGELDEDEDHEPDEGQGLGEGDTEEHGGTHHAGAFRLAGHGRDGVAHDDTDADAGADGGGAVADNGTDGGQSVEELIRGGLGEEIDD